MQYPHNLPRSRCQLLRIPVSEWTVPIFCGTVLGIGLAAALHLKDAYDALRAPRRAKAIRNGKSSA